MEPVFPTKSARHGFTLIEVLVVVAIIALLISILLPSLKAAREEARVVVCSNNLHHIGIACTSYLNANRNRFAWGPTADVVWSHYYGGATDKGDGGSPSDYWNQWYGPHSGRQVAAGSRPLNKYLIGRPLGKNADADLRIYSCPNDDGVRSRGNFDRPKSLNPAYHVMGTSYDANVVWQLYASQKENVPNLANRIMHLKDRIIFIFEKKGASRALLVFEDPADCTLGGVLYNWHPDLLYKTWHPRPNYYTGLFLDGHSEHLHLPHKKVLDHEYTGAGGGFVNCTPSPTRKCLNGDSRWFARQDWRAQ